MSSLPDSQFSPADALAMLALARAAIVSVFEGKTPEVPKPGPPCFSQPRGVFVTVQVFGKLRGCIGVTEARSPLREAIVHCAKSAAFRDPRFPPLRPEEVPGMSIEISLLSPLVPIDAKDIEIGKHGLVVESGSRRGLLLPQVGAEYRLSAVRFLEETCRKAGLAPAAWTDPLTQIYAFTCEIFHDGTPPASAV
jgi:AmmeMemoRadiSam system protein A